MIDGFVKNNDLLEEKSNTKDLLDFTDLCKKFSKKIDSIPGSAIIALVGPFGTGKSTMLDKLMVARSDKETWFEFDAWKYPDRQNLWEGLVLDILKKINPDELEKAKKEFNGTQNDDKKTLVNVLSKIPGFSVLEGLNHFLATTPAVRVNEIQDILTKHLKKIDKDLIIIVEDIDRSGDAGIFFLETLKQFLKTSTNTKRVLIIVPMANDNYQKNIDSYIKSIDYFDFFEPGKEVKLEQFVNEVFDDNLFTGQPNNLEVDSQTPVGIDGKTQLISFFEGLFREMPNMNMRLLKLIVRKANINYKNQVEDGFNPDFRVTICVEASKYFKFDESKDISCFDKFKMRNTIDGNSLFASFMFVILIKQNSIYKPDYSSSSSELKRTSSTGDFKIIERLDNNGKSYPSVPWSFGMFDDKGYGITSFYFHY